MALLHSALQPLDDLKDKGDPILKDMVNKMIEMSIHDHHIPGYKALGYVCVELAGRASIERWG